MDSHCVPANSCLSAMSLDDIAQDVDPLENVPMGKVSIQIIYMYVQFVNQIFPKNDIV